MVDSGGGCREPAHGGFGLSYTSYRYTDLRVDGSAKSATFTVQNTGQRAGSEIAEVYVQRRGRVFDGWRDGSGWR